jgi:hypothetical protein
VVEAAQAPADAAAIFAPIARARDGASTAPGERADPLLGARGGDVRRDVSLVAARGGEVQGPAGFF